MDQSPQHKYDEETFKKHNIVAVKVPKKRTHVFQPCDLHVGHLMLAERQRDLPMGRSLRPPWRPLHIIALHCVAQIRPHIRETTGIAFPDARRPLALINLLLRAKEPGTQRSPSCLRIRKAARPLPTFFLEARKMKVSCIAKAIGETSKEQIVKPHNRHHAGDARPFARRGQGPKGRG